MTGSTAISSWVMAVATLLASAASFAAAPAPITQRRLDSVIAPLSHADHPGCVVGVDHAGRRRVQRAFGAADLEHGIANGVDTIFEAGSVSKQFTAAAVLSLVQDGAIALTDDVRKYVPELPDYGTVITIDHLLNHTNGLRDWGTISAMAGWPRGTRAYEPADVVAIAARQRSLNFAPGAQYSYSNTGYNLLAEIVARVSGKSLATLTRERFFVPLGMRDTQWRDDFRRIVPRRAVAYSHDDTGFRQAMPFENAYGNGGLLTTIADLLRWNRGLDEQALGPVVSKWLGARAQLNDGQSIAYARGLFVDQYRGTAEVAHSGSTGGYRAWLGRYPEHRLSIAVLCNDARANPTEIGHRIADLLPSLAAVPSPESKSPPAQVPALSDKASLAGRFASDEVGVAYDIAEREGRLMISLAGRPSVTSELTPTGSDTFSAPLGGEQMGVRFLRDLGGKVNEISLSAGRAFDVRFQRVRELAGAAVP